MPIQFDSKTLEPLFSGKLLESEVISESEKLLVNNIETLYASLERKTGVYYEGSALGSALESFANSEDFSHLILQLETCFEQVMVFSDAQAISISSEGGSVTARSLLQTFLDKLKTDFFSDRRALLYGPGKKYIETLSAFINEPRIDLNFRTAQIINLLSDEGLTHSCAEGCFTRLQYAADNLKNYNNFEIPTLYKKYLQILADEIIHQPILIGGEETITQKIAKWMNFDPAVFEIHVRNFMLKKFKETFNFETIETVIDEYVNTIEQFFIQNDQKDRLFKINLQYLLKTFNKRATATSFIDYLSTAIHKAALMQVDYMERIKFLEQKVLESFGEDLEFSFAEVLSDETGLLKDEHCLDITLTERLLSKGWLASDWLKYLDNPLFRIRNAQWSTFNLPFPGLTDRYKLYYGNLGLSWISVDSERQKIRTVLQQEKGLDVIQTIHPNPTELLNTLIQTPDDLAFFFNQLASSQQEKALNWIETVPNFVSRVLSYYSQNAATDDLIEPLLSFLSQLESQTIKKLYAEKFYLKERLQSRIKQLSFDDWMMDSVCRGFIKKTSSLRVIDFSKFIFYKNTNYLKSDFSYLIDIDFSDRPLNEIRFYEDVYSSTFAYAEMESTLFYSKLFASDFSFSQLKDARFYNKIEHCFFNNAQLKKVYFYEVVRSDFISASLMECKFTRKLRNCNWTKAKVVKSLFLKSVVQSNFNSAKIEDTLFRDNINSCRFIISQFIRVEFYDLLIDNVFSPAYFSDVRFYAELIDNKFNFATLDNTIFLKKNFRSIFSNSNLKYVFFEKEVHNSIFDFATGFEMYFKKHIKSVNFFHLTLTQAEFREKIEGCDFSESNLGKINFYAEIVDVKFNTALINEVLFTQNIYNCDFVATKMHSAIFYQINLNDINFINSNLNEVHFLESNLFENQFSFGSLIESKFENCKLEQVSFRSINLEGLVFKNTQFKIKIDFIESNLRNANFIDCDLSLINFQDSNLEDLHLKASTITPRQLFDNFYSAGLRDFSEVMLNEQDINKSDFLILYSRKSLKDAILSESVFNILADLGFRNFAKTDLTKLKMEKFIQRYHNFEYNFSEAKLPQIFSSRLSTSSDEQRALSLRECLPKSPRKKRNLASCVISWSDIDPFNLNLEESRNFEKIILDSSTFIKTLFSTKDEKKQRQLVELIDTADISGAAAPALIGLRATQQLKQHFYRVGNLCNALQKGIIYEDIAMDFVHGDYKDVAINVGLLAGSGLSEKFVEQVLIQSEKLGLSGKDFLSQLLKLSTPFLRRGLTTGYIVYDLVKQATALAEGNKNALINCLQDSVFITVDVVETQIEVLEFNGLDSEISQLIKSTGTVVNTLILGGTKVYEAARKVAVIKELITLTPLQTLLQGLEAFLNVNPSQGIQTRIEYAQAYATYSHTIKAFLKENPSIKYYVVPTLDLIKEYRFGEMCNGDMITHTLVNLNSVVYLKIEAQEGLLFNELNPLKNNFKPQEVLCNPYLINLKYETLTCDFALILINPWANETQNQTLFALEEGQDIAYGFSDKPSTFIVDKGYKIYVGGKQSDRFVVKSSEVGGRLDASLGSDLLDLRFYSSNNKSIIIDLVKGTLNEGTSEILSIRNFERILGRSQQKDLIFATHRTEFIDLQGGLASDFDEIIIAHTVRNAHLEMVMRPLTFIKNLATNGDFIYLVPSTKKSDDDTVVNSTQRSDLWVTNHTSTANHTFLFDYDLEDLNTIVILQEVDEYVLFFNFFFNDSNPLTNHTLKLTNIPTRTHYYFKEDTQLTISEKTNFYAFQTSVSSVENLIERYAPLARRLGITMFIHQSLSNEVIVIGHTHHQVLQNDLFANKTHLVANGGGNNYVINSNQQNNSVSVPDVIIYQLTSDDTQHVLDLRELNAEFKGGLLDNPFIDIVVIALGEDLQLALLHKSLQANTENIYQITPVIKILLKHGTQWYQKLTTLFNRVPLQLLKIDPNFWQLQPQPLNVEASYENIILTIDDIEKDNQIFLHRPIHQQHWLRNGSDLWLTTSLTATSYLNKNYTILFRDYFQYPKMQTLRLTFLNFTLSLADCVEEIAHAEDFQEKLTSIELTAWNEVSKHRTVSDMQQNLPPSQSRVLDHRISHAEKIMTMGSVSSSGTRPEGWLNSLFKKLKEVGQDFLLGNPTCSQSISPLTSTKDSKGNGFFAIDHCFSGARYGNTYREGFTCYTKNMQVIIFPKNNNTLIATPEDTYSKQQFRPIEFNDRPAVYFEGDKTHVFYVPEIPENPLDRFNDQLFLMQVFFHQAKKAYRWCKNFFTAKTNRLPLLAEEIANSFVTQRTKISWKESLDNIERQLIDLEKFTEVNLDLRWIKYILEDRREELQSINQLSQVNLETMNAFSENLQALQTELLEIRMNLDSTMNKQDKGFKQSTKNTNISASEAFKHSASSWPNKNKVLIPVGFFNTQSCSQNRPRIECNSTQALVRPTHSISSG